MSAPGLLRALTPVQTASSPGRRSGLCLRRLCSSAPPGRAGCRGLLLLQSLLPLYEQLLGVVSSTESSLKQWGASPSTHPVQGPALRTVRVISQSVIPPITKEGQKRQLDVPKPPGCALP